MEVYSPYMIMSESQLVLELDVLTLSRDELRWINQYCNTSVIDELVEKIMDHNERLEKRLELKDKKTPWLPSPSAPKPKIMKKAPRINPPKFTRNH
tara:strand:- start:2789 stop:3076 length:288 start_codon:yes stop_codon:yes gene_type:complete